VSQIGINYRHSSLSNHFGDEDFEVRAEDRMPSFIATGQSIYDGLKQPKFHFLVFSNGPNKFQALKDELESRYSQAMDFSVFAISHEVQEILGASKDFSVLLRPDNHIGFISLDISSSGVEDYLNEFIGHS